MAEDIINAQSKKLSGKRKRKNNKELNMNKDANLKKKRILLEQSINNTQDSNSQQTQPISNLARALGSVDFHTREKGLGAVQIWLKSKIDISQLDMLKLWKGLFYSFWHSDKVFVQEDLADRLADLIMQTNEKVSFEYFRSYIETLKREWIYIDKYRLNKFLMLTRKMTFIQFLLLSQNKWHIEGCQALQQLYEQDILYCNDGLVSKQIMSLGPSLHLIDIFLDEFTNPNLPTRPSAQVFQLFMETFMKSIQVQESKVLVERIQQEIFQKLYDMIEHQQVQKTQTAALQIQNVDAKNISGSLYQFGLQKNTKNYNRKVLYELSELFEDLHNQISKTQKPLIVPSIQQDIRQMSVQNNTSKDSQALLPVNIVKKKKKKKKELVEDKFAEVKKQNDDANLQSDQKPKIKSILKTSQQSQFQDGIQGNQTDVRKSTRKTGAKNDQQKGDNKRKTKTVKKLRFSL